MLDFVEELGLEVKWYGRGENEVVYYCNDCEVRNSANLLCI